MLEFWGVLCDNLGVVVLLVLASALPDFEIRNGCPRGGADRAKRGLHGTKEGAEGGGEALWWTR